MPCHATPRRNGGDTVEREKGIGVIGGVHTRRPVNTRESKTLERVSILSYKYRNIIAASGLYTGHISIVKIERWFYAVPDFMQLVRRIINGLGTGAILNE